MKKDKLTRPLWAPALVLILTSVLFAAASNSVSSEKRIAPRPNTKTAAAGRALAPAQKKMGEEAMSVSRPLEVQWEKVRKGEGVKRVAPHQGGKDEEDYIDSDLDPETLEKLKHEPFRALAFMPSSYRVQQDSAAARDALGVQPRAPALMASFESIDDGDQLDGFLHRPPDCAIAAGANYVMATVNSLFVIYTKSGTNVGQASYNDFFSSVCAECFPFDPRVVYDSVAGRWILLVVNVGFNDTSNYLLAVSQTSDPTGGWWIYSLDGDLNYPPTAESTWADFPQVGFDAIPAAAGGAVYITSNQFTFGPGGSFRTAMLNILPKSSLYSGGSLNYWRAWGRVNSDGSQAFTLSPAVTYGNSGAEYLANTKNNGSDVLLWKVIPTYPPTALNWTLQSTNSIGAYSIPPSASQPGDCELMATTDSRIGTNAVWRNNKLYMAFSEGYDWGGGSVSAIRYVQINTSTNATEQNVTFGADGLSYFFPAVATDSLGDVILTFARAGSNEFGSIRYTAMQVNDPIGFQVSALLRGGNLCITGGRWGDYFSAAVDPSDPTRVWIYGAWAADVTDVQLPWDWGTWIGQVTVVPCAYSVAPLAALFSAGGGNGSFNVTTGSGCGWSASSDVAWIFTNSSGSAAGTANYTVAANNTTGTRVGHVTVQGETHTVTQSGITPGSAPFDFDLDAKTDLAVFRPQEGKWYINLSSNGSSIFPLLGASTDMIVPEDYDGDGKTDTAVFTPSTGTWKIIDSSTNSLTVVNWGINGDVPVPADYDGDGKADIAVWRPSSGVWYIINSSNGSVTVYGWGISTDKVVPADYDGDGKTDIAAWRPTSGVWYIVNSSNGSVTVQGWGTGTDMPVTGDFDGDGKIDIAIWRSLNGTWYIINSSDGSVRIQPYGQAGDVPVPSAYIR